MYPVPWYFTTLRLYSPQVKGQVGRVYVVWTSVPPHTPFAPVPVYIASHLLIQMLNRYRSVLSVPFVINISSVLAVQLSLRFHNYMYKAILFSDMSVNWWEGCLLFGHWLRHIRPCHQKDIIDVSRQILILIVFIPRFDLTMIVPRRRLDDV